MASISKAEWEVLAALWKQSPLTTAQIITSLEGKSWRPSTVRTFLSRLVKKGLVLAKEGPPSKTYLPARSRREIVAQESTDFLDRVFEGDTTALVNHFITLDKIKKSDLKDLRETLKRMKKK